MERLTFTSSVFSCMVPSFLPSAAVGKGDILTSGMALMSLLKGHGPSYYYAHSAETRVRSQC